MQEAFKEWISALFELKFWTSSLICASRVHHSNQRVWIWRKLPRLTQGTFVSLLWSHFKFRFGIGCRRRDSVCRKGIYLHSEFWYPVQDFVNICPLLMADEHKSVQVHFDTTYVHEHHCTERSVRSRPNKVKNSNLQNYIGTLHFIRNNISQLYKNQCYKWDRTQVGLWSRIP